MFDTPRYDGFVFDSPTSLSEVAKASNNSLEEIARVNGVEDVSRIKVGQSFFAPYEPNEVEEEKLYTEDNFFQSEGMPEHIKNSEMQGNEDKIGKWHGKDKATIGYGVDLLANTTAGSEAIGRVNKAGTAVSKEEAEVVSDYVYMQKHKEMLDVIPEYAEAPEEIKKVIDNLYYVGNLKKTSKMYKALQVKDYKTFMLEARDAEGLRLRRGGL